MAKLICGCGYLGLRVARRWLAARDSVWAITRTSQGATRLLAEGVQPIVADITGRLQLPAELAPLETVLFAVGFDRSAHQALDQVYVGGIRNVLSALPADLSRFIYVSSTGVYAQDNGEWVDEDSPCQPAREGGRACLAAEQVLENSPLQDRRIVLRLAGLYGPGRIPKLAAVKQGEPVDSPEYGYLNLIHVEDAADIVVQAEQRVAPPQTLVVSDGCPVLRGEFYRELARILQAPEPRFASSGSEPQRRGRASSDKRVRNQRLRQLVTESLAFPSYREGLAAIVRATAD